MFALSEVEQTERRTRFAVHLEVAGMGSGLLVHLRESSAADSWLIACLELGLADNEKKELR